MPLSKDESRQLIERLIFADDPSDEWVQDVWGMSPTLGDTAAKLLEVFGDLIELCSEDQLEILLQSYYQDQLGQS
ncbi:hypothetical protein [Leptolyngbya ohadii]|uniref:hypothetical protein n=1 Tax=Leptolyngbya ohadii TaxID=1962290 RepID=UPI000B598852|nr:hypothetical protein [Leptolyngbya ohadii]